MEPLFLVILSIVLNKVFIYIHLKATTPMVTQELAPFLETYYDENKPKLYLFTCYKYY